MESSEIKKAISAVLSGDAVLLDVRRQDEWDAGHAGPAIHFDSPRILEDGELPEVSKDKTIYVYCRSGGRAGRVKNELLRQGYYDVHNLGGLSDWQANGGK